MFIYKKKKIRQYQCRYCCKSNGKYREVFTIGTSDNAEEIDKFIKEGKKMD